MLTRSVRELEEIMKKLLFDDIENQADRLIEMADIIFDNPETGGEEKVAAGLLAGYLETWFYCGNRAGRFGYGFSGKLAEWHGRPCHRPSV